MMELYASASEGERERLIALEATRLVDSPASEDFDRITRLAARTFGVPTALVSLVTADRQWFKSRVGMDCAATERESAFCAHTIRCTDVMVVEDATLDDRFKENRLVTGQPHIRFYAGAPLITPQGHALGSLCVIDYSPRTFGAEDRETLQDMARMVMAQINLAMGVGRVHEVTGMPNRAQLKSDLVDLSKIGDAGNRALVVIDIMSHAGVQAALLALGISALEKSVRHIASRLTSLMQAGTVLYHVSDTRFAYMLSAEDAGATSAAIDAVLTRMREPLQVDGIHFNLDLRCGAVAFDARRDKLSDLMRMATTALVRPRSAGNSFHWYEPAFDLPHKRSYALVRTLPESLRSDQFRLVYQPKFNVASNRCTGVEALLRWSHPVMGNVSPAEFIPVVEKTEAIHPITHWVLSAALAQVAQWQKQGLYLTVAVNVSSRNLEQPQFAQSVADACARHDVNPRYLHIECTENAALTGTRTLAALHALRTLGVDISLDDFGVGYSNIACLQELPVTLIKLDQSLVKPITKDARARTLAQSLIAFGHSLGYRVLAEGVEDEETFGALEEAGCDAVQGYHVSRPLEAAAVADWFRNPSFQRPHASRS